MEAEETYERYLVPNSGGFPVRVVKLAKEIRKLRELLWINHGCSSTALYGDDGEMQCNACWLDFKRDPIDKIEETIVMRNVTRGQKAFQEVLKEAMAKEEK